MFELLWRLSILTLPFQTRWFHDASLAGWPWEQGRWSVYVSWGLMLGTVAVGMILPLTKGELEGVVRPAGDLPNPSFVRR